MRVGPEGLPQPWAAEKVERPDATTVNVTLRKGMKWSDGQPVTIEDAVFSLEAPGYGDKAPMYKPFVHNIASVEATGPDTLTIKLKRPDAAFLVSSLSKLNLAPKHIWQPIFDDLKNKPQTAESIMEEHPVSSGPFRIVRASLNQEIVLEANPGSLVASEDPSLDHAHHAERRGIGGRAEERRDQFPCRLHRRSGAAEGSRQVVTQYRSVARRWTSASSSSRTTSVARRSTIWRSVRRISAVIDRKLLAEDAWGGAAEPANSWISPALGVWHAKGIVDRVPGGNVAAAQKILKDAGFVLVGNVLHYPKGEKETTEPFRLTAACRGHVRPPPAGAWVVATLTFLLFRLMPGDPTLNFLSPTFTDETRAALLKSFGLDKPLVGAIPDLSRPAAARRFRAVVPAASAGRRVLWAALPNTAILTLVSLCLAYAFGIVAGAFLAFRRGALVEAAADPRRTCHPRRTGVLARHAGARAVRLPAWLVPHRRRGQSRRLAGFTWHAADIG